MAEQTQHIADYYGDLVRRYGCDARACDYGGSVSQHKKFQVLSECSDYTGKSVLDIGCGYAAYGEYLQERFPSVRYTGVELCPEMASMAKSEHPELTVIEGDFLDLELKRHDIVTANGIFYLLGEQAESIMYRIIEKMWSLADELVAFNCLSAWRVEQEEGEFYADPLKTMEYCRNFTPWLSLRHDYHPGDFTICMYGKSRI
jgi:SAM-dependent methyltransferase